MRLSPIPVLCIFFLVGGANDDVPTSRPQPQVTGTFTLTKWVADASEVVQTGEIGPNPIRTGHSFHSGEFHVPGEERSLPKGIHFRISPASIREESSVVDVLLADTTVDLLTDDGFTTSSTQTESRQVVPYGKPFSVSLQLPNSKVRYQVEFTLRRQ
ncbi:MAG: hypothetical protein U0996_09515 [Planctomycetaceae bacterium]